MDTSANKELVCMLLQGIANKLPEEHQSLVATAETAIRGKEAPVDEIVKKYAVMMRWQYKMDLQPFANLQEFLRKIFL